MIIQFAQNQNIAERDSRERDARKSEKAAGKKCARTNPKLKQKHQNKHASVTPAHKIATRNFCKY